MRNALGTGVLAVVGAVLAAACDDDPPPTDRRVFRDNFDSLAPGWQVSEGVSIESGSLQLAARSGPAPEATYTFPTPYGPRWEVETSLSLGAGLACLGVEVYAGDVRRHTWDMEVGFQQDTITTFFDWRLRVGDGADAWEELGVAPALQVATGPVRAKIQVWGEVVTLWIQEFEVLSTTVFEATDEAVSVKLTASRCRIRAGIMTVDWIQVSEVD